jgi:hypothetical protein
MNDLNRNGIHRLIAIAAIVATFWLAKGLAALLGI